MADEQLTHFNRQQRAKMVDVSHKQTTKRVAVAKSRVTMAPATLKRVQDGTMGKGDVLAVAQVAGIMAAKQTSELVPMCHPLPLTGVDIFFDTTADDAIAIEAQVKTVGVTGVEMEALTAASVAALTIYDMCKAIDKEMTLGPTYVAAKSGGKSGDYVREQPVDVPDVR
ncbi:cyclic pyranopterin monophosphate synthase MoaC [Numidum massiliense]|uniref:cyclic pyranopterin monophosphate synthase MoaC n=1 Tax=Numidum massiliense TaxID=1522315 RepID=UPI0006D56827|nr:cyclic pyranopterin monophosphate synthase MoaC [Numidum massiliense]